MKKRTLMTGLAAAAAGMGYMAAKKQHENKSPYHKLLHKLEDMMD